jgi:hypothetical protein
VHLLAGAHDTLPSRCTVEPAGLAVPCSAHEVPFQPAAMVRWAVDHTAVHAVAVGHDTPADAAGALSFGPGAGWMDHEVPFHDSASVPS